METAQSNLDWPEPIRAMYQSVLEAYELSAIEQRLFLMCADWAAVYHNAMATVAREGLTQTSDRGNVSEHCALKTARAAANSYRLCARELNIQGVPESDLTIPRLQVANG